MDSLGQPPKTFGHQGAYQVVSELGRGGFATVYKAYQQTLDRHVAIKVLRPEVLQDEAGLERFQREARAAARLGGHPHILTIHDYGEQDGLAYLVLEFIEGTTLEQRLTQPISTDETERIIAAVASALDHAHANQLIHRDIKPANVLLSKDGRIVLSDFGIAKLLDSAGVSMTGTMIGTPQYMSPEQILGNTVDARSDIYSLGVMLYRMVSGRPPFQGGVATMLHQHVYEAPPPITTTSAGWPVPPGLQPVVQRALAKEPADRHASAGELAAELSRALRPGGGAQPAPSVVDVDVDAATIMPPASDTPAPARAPRAEVPTVATEIASGPVQRPHTPVPSHTPPPSQSPMAPQTPVGAALPARVDGRRQGSNHHLTWGIVVGVVVLAVLIGALVATGFFQRGAQVATTSTPATAPTAVASGGGAPATTAAGPAPGAAPSTSAARAVPAAQSAAPASTSAAAPAAAGVPPAQATGGAVPPPPLTTARDLHTISQLDGGRILVVGGRDGAAEVASAELFDPAANSWSPAGTMSTPRFRHSATPLPGGKILIAGGQGPDAAFLTTTELYDPASNSWSAGKPMSVARAAHSATVLPDGKVLVAGGFNGSSFHNTAELYDPAEGSWRQVAPMAEIHVYHTATRLADGRVLVAGGFGSTAEAAAEQYDPAGDRWTAAGSMTEGRINHTATRLSNGKVLVVGGGNSTGGGTYLASAELYDPATNGWSGIARMADARGGHAAVLLSGDRVLVAGGRDKERSLPNAELFDSTANAWSPSGAMASARWLPTAAPLPSGRILMVGGRVGNHSLATVEEYDPSANGWVAAPQQLKMKLVAQNDSGINGVATLTELGGGKTRVEIRVEGAGPGPQPAHIHEGTCTKLNATPLHALTSVIDGASVTELNATLQQLTSSPQAIHMHKSLEELPIYVTCADTRVP